MIPPPGGGGATSQEAYIYLLRSNLDGTYYLGWTTNVLRRLVEHNKGLVYFSRRKRPWQLVGIEKIRSIAAAKSREKILKCNPRMLQFFKKRMLNRLAVGQPHQVVG